MQGAPAAPGDSIPNGPDDRPLLAIGCFASICGDRLVEELLAFSRHYPQVDIGVREMARGPLLRALRAGDLALAVLPGPEEAGLCSVELWQGQVMAAMPIDHPLARRTALRPADLAAEPMLVSRQEPDGDMHRFLAGRILPQGSALHAAILDLDPPRIQERVAAGEGLTLVCDRNGASIGRDVTTRPIDAPGARFAVRAFWRNAASNWPLSALIERLTAGRRPDR